MSKTYYDRYHPVYIAYTAILNGDNSKVKELPEDIQQVLNTGIKYLDSGLSAYQCSQITELPSAFHAELKRLRNKHNRQGTYKIKYFAGDFLNVLSQEESISVKEIAGKVGCSPAIAATHISKLKKAQKVEYTISGKVTILKAV